MQSNFASTDFFAPPKRKKLFRGTFFAPLCPAIFHRISPSFQPLPYDTS